MSNDDFSDETTVPSIIIYIYTFGIVYPLTSILLYKFYKCRNEFPINKRLPNYIILCTLFLLLLQGGRSLSPVYPEDQCIYYTYTIQIIGLYGSVTMYLLRGWKLMFDHGISANQMIASSSYKDVDKSEILLWDVDEVISGIATKASRARTLTTPLQFWFIDHRHWISRKYMLRIGICMLIFYLLTFTILITTSPPHISVNDKYYCLWWAGSVYLYSFVAVFAILAAILAYRIRHIEDGSGIKSELSIIVGLIMLWLAIFLPLYLLVPYGFVERGITVVTLSLCTIFSLAWPLYIKNAFDNVNTRLRAGTMPTYHGGLSSILKDPRCREDFRNFVTEECELSSLVFYESVERFNDVIKINPLRALHLAKKIVTQSSTDGEFPVEYLPVEIRQNLFAVFYPNYELTATFFDEAMDIVINYMEDFLYPLYIHKYHFRLSKDSNNISLDDL